MPYDAQFSSFPLFFSISSLATLSIYISSTVLEAPFFLFSDFHGLYSTSRIQCFEKKENGEEDKGKKEDSLKYSIKMMCPYHQLFLTISLLLVLMSGENTYLISLDQNVYNLLHILKIIPIIWFFYGKALLFLPIRGMITIGRLASPNVPFHSNRPDTLCFMGKQPSLIFNWLPQIYGSWFNFSKQCPMGHPKVHDIKLKNLCRNFLYWSKNIILVMK